MSEASPVVCASVADTSRRGSEGRQGRSRAGFVDGAEAESTAASTTAGSGSGLDFADGDQAAPKETEDGPFSDTILSGGSSVEFSFGTTKPPSMPAPQRLASIAAPTASDGAAAETSAPCASSDSVVASRSAARVSPRQSPRRSPRRAAQEGSSAFEEDDEDGLPEFTFGTTLPLQLPKLPPAGSDGDQLLRQAAAADAEAYAAGAAPPGKTGDPKGSHREEELQYVKSSKQSSRQQQRQEQQLQLLQMEQQHQKLHKEAQQRQETPHPPNPVPQLHPQQMQLEQQQMHQQQMQQQQLQQQQVAQQQYVAQPQQQLALQPVQEGALLLPTSAPTVAPPMPLQAEAMLVQQPWQPYMQHLQAHVVSNNVTGSLGSISPYSTHHGLSVTTSTISTVEMSGEEQYNLEQGCETSAADSSAYGPYFLPENVQFQEKSYVLTCTPQRLRLMVAGACMAVLFVLLAFAVLLFVGPSMRRR